ncbi:hypothetical protein NQ314_002859 [Rhamnusium bicolor]|uniref:Ionotropic glutamate receptor n=1 Tax=Rhamnusium bicolor TaxID=1586634 RepID=A0AAV8ZND0_9CUCU|nr:hypothetical protein NQ314_002859 [Rhamnusium bicolor]
MKSLQHVLWFFFTGFYHFRLAGSAGTSISLAIVCDVLNHDEGVAAVFGVESSTSSILQSISEHFNMPYISTSWRASPNTKDNTILNFFPEAELFAKGLAAVVTSLQWDNFVIIYESKEGLIKMQEILKLQEYNVRGKEKNIFVKQLDPSSDHRAMLKEIKKLSEINIILDCRTEHILPILKQAKDMKLLDLLSRIFLTSLDAHTLDYSTLNTTANITTLRLFDEKMDDFKNTVRRWELSGFRNNNTVISIATDDIKTETILFHDALLLLTDSINGLTSKNNMTTNPVDCNESMNSKNGYLITAYMKVRNPSLTLSGPLKFDEYGNRVDFILRAVDIINNKEIALWYAHNETLKLTRSPNETNVAVVDSLRNILVIVSTRSVLQTSHFINSRLGKPYLMEKEKKEGEEYEGNNKYEGYSLDVIKAIANEIKFQFEIHVTENNEYGKFDEKKNRWTGLVGDLLARFLYCTMTPGDWENPHPCDENPEELENIWDIKNCLWLTLGSIMTQGCDILTKGISSRTLVAMWWFFSLVMANSYMANLTAFLTKNKMEPTIDGAEALSKQTKIKYGAVEGGSTQAFFRDATFPTYAKMWINMQSSSPSVFERTNEDGVHRVETSTKGSYAFLMESTQIEYEIETRCNLKQVGDLLDSKSYGIAMPINLWLKNNKYSLNESVKDSNSSDLDLTNVGGAFLVLGVGLGIAILIGISDFLWTVKNLALEEHKIMANSNVFSFTSSSKISPRGTNIKRPAPVYDEPDDTFTQTGKRICQPSLVELETAYRTHVVGATLLAQDDSSDYFLSNISNFVKHSEQLLTQVMRLKDSITIRNQIIMDHCAMVRIFSSMCSIYAANNTETKLDERLDSIERQIQNISSKSPKTYSAAVTSPAVRPPPRRSTRVRLPSGKTVVPVNKSVIILKPIEGNQSIKTSDDIKKALVSNLNPRYLGIKLHRMSRAGSAGLRLESLTSDLTNIPADNLAKAGLSANFPSKLQPRLAIYNVPSNLSSDELLQALISQNFSNQGSHL